MLIKVPITHIPVYWELIKNAALNLNNISSTEAATYSKNLLIRLLTKKCFCVFVHKDKDIQAMLLMEFRQHIYTKKKYLSITGAYGLRKMSDETWATVAENLEKFARVEKCDSIYGYTKNKRIEEILTNAEYYIAEQTFVRKL